MKSHNVLITVNYAFKGHDCIFAIAAGQFHSFIANDGFVPVIAAILSIFSSLFPA